MIRIGLVGESPYDTDAIRNLLSKKYRSCFHFVKLISHITGDLLERTAKVQRLLQAELKTKSDISFLIFIRDLDALESNSQAVQDRKKWFNKLKKAVGIESVFLLNIVELEALILADIESFNMKYKTTIPFTGDPMRKMNPKEFLMEQTRDTKKQFKVSDNAELFKILNVEVVKANCRYFRTFLVELDALKQ